MPVQPITLTQIEQPVNSNAKLTAEQVSAFHALLEQSGLIALPSDKTVQDIVNFNVHVQPNGEGFLNIAVK
jgi:hypothetical protein